MRTKDQHYGLIKEIQDDGIEEDWGVKDSWVFSDHFSYLHPITVFPPDILDEKKQNTNNNKDLKGYKADDENSDLTRVKT